MTELAPSELLACPCGRWQVEYPRSDAAAVVAVEEALRAHLLECRTLRRRFIRSWRPARFLRCSR